MSVEKFKELKSLLSLDESQLIGFTLYFLEEDSDSQLNPIKIEISSEDMGIEDSILGLNSMLENKELASYLQETDLSSKETIGFINEEEYLDSVNRIKSIITSGNALEVMSKHDDMSDVKGLLVYLKIKNDSEEKDLLLYSQITRRNIYEKKSLWSINNEREVILENVNKPMINLNLHYCCIHYADNIFVLHPHFFEQLFKFYMRFKKAAEDVLKVISSLDIISNFSEFEKRCLQNKNFQRKLFHVKQSARVDEISYKDFYEINERVDGKLKIIFNNDETISIDMSDMHQSLDQIIRIMNNEAAETILSQEAIFAGRKQMIE